MFIERSVYGELVDHLERREISLIIGPRQAGKTTLMLRLQEELERRGERTLFLSLDFDRDIPAFESQTALLNRVELEMGKRGGVIFVDEIQRRENAGIFLKGLFDMGIPYKLVVSGSGSLELKEKIYESLVGRKRVFRVNTVSLKEFMDFKTGYRYRGKIRRFAETFPGEARALLEEYMMFGGYPRVVLEETLEEKVSTLDEIFSSYVERDISYLLGVEKIDAYRTLLKLLAAQTGGLLNLQELSSMAGISLPTLKKYLTYAQKTFVISLVPPFFRNVRKEVRRAKTVYFHDLGLRNFVLGHPYRLLSPEERGFLFQNLVFRVLSDGHSRSNVDIRYWRTASKAEVDFVVEVGSEIVPVEVKWTKKTPKVSRSLRSFLDRYQPKEAWIVTPGSRSHREVGGTIVKVMTIWDLVHTCYG